MSVVSAQASPTETALPSLPVRAAAPLRGVTNTASWLVAMLVFLSISRFHDEIGALAALRTPMLLSLLSMLVLGSQTPRWRPRDLKRHWLPRAVGVTAVIAIVGVPFGIYPGHSFFFLKDAFLRTLLVGVMVWAVCRTPRGTIRIARTVALACVTTAALAMFRGRVDSAGRLSASSMYDPNDLSLICVLGLPLVLWLMADLTAKRRWMLAPAIPLLVLVIVRTDSRGGFLGLAAVAIGFLLLSVRKTTRRAQRVSRLAVLLCVVAVPFAPPDYRERIRTIFSDEEDYNRTSETGRIAIWKRGMGYAFDRPIFGVGIDNFSTAEGLLSDVARARLPGQGFKWSATHNSFVQAWAELGLIAGTSFLVAVWGAPFALVRRRRGNRQPSTSDDELAPFLALGLLGMATTAVFLSVAYYDVVYVNLALATGILERRRAMDAAPRVAQRGATTPA